VKFAFTTLGCPAWTLEQAVAAADAYGYDGIELRLLDDQTITPELLIANRDRIKRAFSKANVKLIALGSSARFSMADRAEREQHEKTTAALIPLAAELGAPLIRVFGGNLPKGVSMSEGIENVAASLNKLAPIAEAARVALVLETHDDFSKATDVADVLSRVPSPAIGALWDTQPPYEFGESASQVLALLGNRILHTHVKDARKVDGGPSELVLLGEGDVPVREILQQLIASGYQGYAAVEWEKKWIPKLADPEVAFPQHIRMLREYVGTSEH
jgi:sugar phosphate isomerase/epimerase